MGSSGISNFWPSIVSGLTARVFFIFMMLSGHTRKIHAWGDDDANDGGVDSDSVNGGGAAGAALNSSIYLPLFVQRGVTYDAG